MTFCEPSEPRYARRQPFPNPGEHPPKPPNLGSVAGRTPEFLDEFPPAGRLGFFVPARDKHPQTPFAEEVDFQRGGRPQEAGLNLSGQLQKVHNLGDTSPRDAFPGAILALVSRVPDRNPACVDAICREAAARILRVRRAENDYRRGTVPGTSLMWGLDLAVAYVLLAFIETPPEPGILARYRESLS